MPPLPAVQPFHSLVYPMTLVQMQRLAAAYALRAALNVASVDFPPPPMVVSRGVWLSPGERIRVGYVSSDFGNHPLAHLMQSVFGLHDRSRFEVFGYSLSPDDGSPWRRRIQLEMEHFFDVSNSSPEEIARLVGHVHRIHVLVNLNGYTKGARNELFVLRPAPIQVSYMGFCGTMGADFIDYLIADETVVPATLAPAYTETIAYMPHCYFVTDHKQSAPEVLDPSLCPTRAVYGIPEDKFVFANFNQIYKIDPKTFQVWCRLLHRVPNSILWLLRFPPAGEANIRLAARAHGVRDDQLFFTDVAPKDEHLRRGFLADLFLDTPACNAHTTGCDILWGGVPMVTVPGEKMASRVAASLLNAAGLAECVTASLREYEELVFHLATHPERLRALRARLEATRTSMPLFDTARWVRNLEHTYAAIWKHYWTDRSTGRPRRREPIAVADAVTGTRLAPISTVAYDLFDTVEMGEGTRPEDAVDDAELQEDPVHPLHAVYGGNGSRSARVREGVASKTDGLATATSRVGSGSTTPAEASSPAVDFGPRQDGFPRAVAEASSRSTHASAAPLYESRVGLVPGAGSTRSVPACDDSDDAGPGYVARRSEVASTDGEEGASGAGRGGLLTSDTPWEDPESMIAQFARRHPLPPSSTAEEIVESVLMSAGESSGSSTSSSPIPPPGGLSFAPPGFPGFGGPATIPGPASFLLTSHAPPSFFARPIIPPTRHFGVLPDMGVSMAVLPLMGMPSATGITIDLSHPLPFGFAAAAAAAAAGVGPVSGAPFGASPLVAATAVHGLASVMIPAIPKIPSTSLLFPVGFPLVLSGASPVAASLSGPLPALPAGGHGILLRTDGRDEEGVREGTWFEGKEDLRHSPASTPQGTRLVESDGGGEERSAEHVAEAGGAVGGAGDPSAAGSRGAVPSMMAFSARGFGTGPLLAAGGGGGGAWRGPARTTLVAGNLVPGTSHGMAGPAALPGVASPTIFSGPLVPGISLPPLSPALVHPHSVLSRAPSLAPPSLATALVVGTPTGPKVLPLESAHPGWFGPR